MFGHQAEPAQQQPQPADQGNDQTTPADDTVVAGAPNPALPPVDDSAQATPVTDTNNLIEPVATDGHTADEASSVSDDTSAATPDTIEPAEPTVGTPGPLSDLKQQALQQLSPLVDKLEQTPEEKFRTTMMMIQASDNQDLLQSAYDAANQISDEKAKAQALLDVINEINYFSQKSA
jgi:hypothetical protein